VAPLDSTRRRRPVPRLVGAHLPEL